MSNVVKKSESLTEEDKLFILNFSKGMSVSMAYASVYDGVSPEDAEKRGTAILETKAGKRELNNLICMNEEFINSKNRMTLNGICAIYNKSLMDLEKLIETAYENEDLNTVSSAIRTRNDIATKYAKLLGLGAEFKKKKSKKKEEPKNITNNIIASTEADKLLSQLTKD